MIPNFSRSNEEILNCLCFFHGFLRKYEEICAPRVEEFCFITDNTYTKAEVLYCWNLRLFKLYSLRLIVTYKTPTRWHLIGIENGECGSKSVAFSIICSHR